MIAIAVPAWQWINLRHALRNSRYRFIHDDVFGRLDDFEIRNTPIVLDSDFDQRRNLTPGSDIRRRLDPCAVKTIVQHIAIPAEFRCAVPGASVATCARGSFFAGGMRWRSVPRWSSFLDLLFLRVC